MIFTIDIVIRGVVECAAWAYESIAILALDSDGDGVPDYKDVFPTVNEDLIFFSNLLAAAVMLWITVFLSPRPRRLKAP